MSTLRCETAKGVRHIVLCRSDDYNTITPEFRDELARTATGKLQKFTLRAPYWDGVAKGIN